MPAWGSFALLVAGLWGLFAFPMWLVYARLGRLNRLVEEQNVLLAKSADDDDPDDPDKEERPEEARPLLKAVS